MQSMPTMIVHLARKPMLVHIGLLMTFVVLLAVVSMLSSVFIAETTEGMATAINQSGSLRMQSYRIGVALADESVPANTRAARAAALADEFEHRLQSPRLVNAIPGHTGDELAQAYARVTDLWRRKMEPPLADQVRLLDTDAAARGKPPPRAEYLMGVDAFVAEIDGLVRLLEEVAERRIDILRGIQAVALVLTVTIVIFTMMLVFRRVILPLGDLLSIADRVRQGDFSRRTIHTGRDELGRLGAAMNLMAEGLSSLYGGLEARVAEKTRDLARTNQSLELLYRSSKALNEEPVTDKLLLRVLRDIQEQLRIGPATLCLRTDQATGPGRQVVTTRRESAGRCAKWNQGCRACSDDGISRAFNVTTDTGTPLRVFPFPISDRDQYFGVLLVDLSQDQDLQPWQRRLLTTLAGHIGTALTVQQRMRESRRLVLHEERSIIARELHDSLAQSLSYLKIQVTRLAAALEHPDGRQKPKAVLGELRDGISSAYRQLRELLTTFRLRMDDRGLRQALQDTVQEFCERSAVDIALDDRLPGSLLTPNEEIHVLQIVREALSNVVRHANARRASVVLSVDDRDVEVRVSDNGRGYLPPNDQAAHHGLTIMRERTLSLAGTLTLDTLSGGGTLVRLRFRQRAAGTADTPGTDVLAASAAVDGRLPSDRGEHSSQHPTKAGDRRAKRSDQPHGAAV